MKQLHYIFIFSFLILVSSEALAQAQTNLDRGMRFIEQSAQKWGLQESDYIHSEVTDMYTDKKTGITFIYLIQTYKGIPIFNAITPISIDKAGVVRTVRHGFIPNTKKKILATTHSLKPVAAIKAAVTHLGIKAKSMPSLRRSNNGKNIYDFGSADFAGNEIQVKLMYIKDGESLILAWNLAIEELDKPDYYNVFIDANSGDFIYKFNHSVKCTIHRGKYGNHTSCINDHQIQKSSTANPDETKNVAGSILASGGSYNVFELPIESPLYGERKMSINPAFSDSSPFGWHDTNGVEGPEYTITRGNNTHAYLDKSDGGVSNGDEPDGGDNCIFDFPYDPMDEASENEKAAVVNMFYTTNMIHDISKRLGFDEPAGNFQQNNYGNGGNGNDHVLAQASDGVNRIPPSLDNALFISPGDGGNGVMEMYLWTNASGVLSIDEPEILSGFVNNVGNAMGSMGFGAFIPDEGEAPIKGKVVLAKEDAAGEPTTVCGPIKNTSEVSGNIAMIDRGICDYSLKAWHAQEAGAISVIICNIVGGDGGDGSLPIFMDGGQKADEITIVPISLGKPDCDRIKASLLSDIDVRITIQDRDPEGPQYFDGAFDNGIVIHEYAHGISNRLIGGPANSGCVFNLEQATEGISDFFALATTVEVGDEGTDSRGVANYVQRQTTSGTGIRTYPYSTDMDINPLVYDDIKTRNPLNYDPVSPHPLGEVWAIALWEVYWAFVNEFGLDTQWEDEESGNYKSVRLVIEGMKHTPCNPSMIDLRDGILRADSILYDAEHAGMLWIAFAKRGFGYLADDGGNSNNVSDGTQSFEPFPLVIEKLKIRAKVSDNIKPGDETTVELFAVNHIPENQTGVVVNVEVPDGMTYVEGSATIDANFDNGVLEFDLGDMEYLDERTFLYRVLASEAVTTKTYFYDNIDDANLSDYDAGFFSGGNLWGQSTDVANSGEVSWWASLMNTNSLTDFWLTIPPLDIVGSRPALRFANRFNTDIGVDGGFLQVSTDGEIFEDVRDKFIRNGYNTDIQYGTFAIPLLEGFSGSTNTEWLDTYLDLSAYKGERIIVRYRFGSYNDTEGNSQILGWFVDDLELIDLRSYEMMACISSDNTTVDQCSEMLRIFIESDQMVDTKVEELEGFELSVSPNPASEYVSVGVAAKTNTPIQLLLTSIDGRVIKSSNMLATTNQSIRTFDTSTLEKGMYLIQIKSESGLTTKKLVIQ